MMAFRVGSGVLLTVLLLLLFCARTSSAFGNDEFQLRFTLTFSQFEKLRDGILNIIGRTGDSPRLLQRAARLNKLQPTVPYDEPFPCDTRGYRSPTKPTSVHRLRPGDIDIVGALGDSLTAGNGAAASQVFHVYTENRGISWSIGGKSTWREYLTLPNILKEFNPKLFGYSLADSFTHHRDSQFNVGEIGAMSNDLPFMARQLIKRIKSDPRVDLDNDWKLLTILMGSNDFCIDICYVDAQAAPERHRRNLIAAIDLIRKNLPRTIVQIVVSPNLGLIITRFRGVSPICQLTHSGECPCLFGLAYTNRQLEFIDIMRRWQQAELDAADDPRFKGYNDFAVVAQTFTENLTFPETVDRFGNRITDFSYLSEDCFHFSQKGYSRAANALWNNMFQRVGEKSTNWQMEFKHFICPTPESPYIYTYGNS